MDALVVISTFPDPATARRIATSLVEDRLAACVNLLPAVESVYRWKGAVETATETMAICKTTRANYPALEAALRERHPYDTPEILAVPATAGLEDYLLWIRESTTPAD